jgi:pyruvate dehydrogenase E2 component (dihydrolipoamide acetyltransferase)
VDADSLLAVRDALNGHFAEQKSGARVSINDFVIRAAALALSEVPAANASFAEVAIREHTSVDISVAVSTPSGLITPIIRQADKKSLTAISAEMKALVARAREGKLRPEEFRGGSFSISNLGMYGIKQFDAIINSPQSCILAIGAGEQRAVARDSALAIATMMSCTLAVDHRVIDGALAAKFLQSFKRAIEEPNSLQ